jgi:hypothetical protein
MACMAVFSSSAAMAWAMVMPPASITWCLVQSVGALGSPRTETSMVSATPALGADDAGKVGQFVVLGVVGADDQDAVAHRLVLWLAADRGVSHPPDPPWDI